MNKRQPTSSSDTRRGRRMRAAGAALSLTAAVTAGGIAMATPASAKITGDTSFTIKGHPTNVWGATWSQAWKYCKEHRGTKSIQLLKSTQTDNPDTTTVLWACRDTP